MWAWSGIISGVHNAVQGRPPRPVDDQPANHEAPDNAPESVFLSMQHVHVLYMCAI